MKIKLGLVVVIVILASCIIYAAEYGYDNPNLPKLIKENLYCALTGCNMAGDLNMNGHNILNVTNMTTVNLYNVTGSIDLNGTSITDIFVPYNGASRGVELGANELNATAINALGAGTSINTDGSFNGGEFNSALGATHVSGIQWINIGTYWRLWNNWKMIDGNNITIDNGGYFKGLWNESGKYVQCTNSSNITCSNGELAFNGTAGSGSAYSCVNESNITCWYDGINWHYTFNMSLTETDPIYSANTYATGMNQGVATSNSPTFAGITSDLATLGYEIPTYDFTTSLTGYWKCNDTSWTGANAVVDSSGNAHHGTATGAVSQANSRNNVYNGYFDGTNDDVTIADNADFDATTAVTVSAWIYRTADSGALEWIVTKWRSTGNQRSYALRILTGTTSIPDNSIAFSVSNDGTTAAYNVISSSQIALNTWYHITGVYDGAFLKIYVNGVLENTLAYASGIKSSTANVIFGSYHELGAYNYQGRLEEVRIYKDRALSQTEIAQLASDDRFTGNAHFEKGVRIAGSLSIGSATEGMVDLSNAMTGTSTAHQRMLLKLSQLKMGSSETGGPFGSGFVRLTNGQEIFNLISTAQNTIFGGGVDGDAYRRFLIDTYGLMSWGSGAATRDTYLTRLMANTLLISSDGANGAGHLQLRDNGYLKLGTARDASIGFNGTALLIKANSVTASDKIILQSNTSIASGNDLTLEGGVAHGVIDWINVPISLTLTGTTACTNLNNLVAGYSYTCQTCNDALLGTQIACGTIASVVENCACKVT